MLIFLVGQVIDAARYNQYSTAKSATDKPHRNLCGKFFPSMVTGDLAKSALLFCEYPGESSFLVASVVYDCILGLAAVLIVATFGTLLLRFMRYEWVFAWYIVVLGLLFIVTVLALASNVGLALMLQLPPKIFAAELQKLLRTHCFLIPILGLSLGFQFSWAISQWIMLDTISPNGPFVPILAASHLLSLWLFANFY